MLSTVTLQGFCSNSGLKLEEVQFAVDSGELLATDDGDICAVSAASYAAKLAAKGEQAPACSRPPAFSRSNLRATFRLADSDIDNLQLAGKLEHLGGCRYSYDSVVEFASKRAQVTALLSLQYRVSFYDEPDDAAYEIEEICAKLSPSQVTAQHLADAASCLRGGLTFAAEDHVRAALMPLLAAYALDTPAN
jgi:hypothetical protein